MEINQAIYDHGGSRIWREVDGRRDLLADTYGSKELAVAVRVFIEGWLTQSAEGGDETKGAG